MTSQDYRAVLDTAMSRYGELLKQREDVEIEIKKIKQFISATIHMLTDDERELWWATVDEGSERFISKQSSLADEIRDVLCESPKQWLTVAQVRDRLKAKEFDFSAYTSNPLASISTTLKRLCPKEAESAEFDDVTAYRWKSTKAAKQRMARKSLEQFYGQLLDADTMELFTSKPPDNGVVMERPPGSLAAQLESERSKKE